MTQTVGITAAIGTNSIGYQASTGRWSQVSAFRTFACLRGNQFRLHAAQTADQSELRRGAAAHRQLGGGDEGGGQTGVESIEDIVPDPPAEPPAAAPAPPTAPETVAVVEPVDLVVTARRGRSVAEIRRGSAAGELLYAGTLARGQTKRFTGKQLWLRLGKIQNLDLTLNGSPAGDESATGATVIVVTADGVRNAESS